MGGRGTYAAGINVKFIYKTVSKIAGVKVLEGIYNAHSLPEEAHSSKAYIKLKKDGTFHEMRIYGKDKRVIFEVAYHPEKKLGKGNILHYHFYSYEGGNFNRTTAIKLHKNTKLYKEIKRYLKGVE